MSFTSDTMRSIEGLFERHYSFFMSVGTALATGCRDLKRPSPWTAKEDHQVAALRARGLYWSEIGAEMGRSHSCCRIHWQQKHEPAPKRTAGRPRGAPSYAVSRPFDAGKVSG
jgi:hypothetical protein